MIISHDLGTTGDKATLVDTDGRVVAADTARYGTDFGARGMAEQDPEAWWQALCEASCRLIQSVPRAREKIAGVCFSGQMMGAVLLDNKGQPVRPAIIWADTRSTEQTNQLIERIGMETAYRITGHRLNPTYSLEKIMWVRDNEPDVFARTTHVVLAKDFMVHRLTGVLVTDPSDASGTNAFDQLCGTWSEELLEAASLTKTLLPEIAASTTVVGTVTPVAAAATGLRVGTPVVLGGGDGPMAGLGAGIVDSSCGAYVYLGSSAWVSLAADAPLHDPQMRSMTFNHVVPGCYTPTATMQAGGASLQWIMDLLAPEEDGRYERLLEAASHVQASEDGLFFLPYLLGERSPYWNPHARAVFAGLDRHHGPEHLARAVVEGVAFNLYSCLQAFTENGTQIDHVDAIGGAANSSHLLRILADTWGVPVRQRDLVDEATSLGAAIVGGVGVGIFENFDVAKRFSKVRQEELPDPIAHDRYARAHALFVEAYRCLEPWFDRL
jgi:xylulokinase